MRTQPGSAMGLNKHCMFNLGSSLLRSKLSGEDMYRLKKKKKSLELWQFQDDSQYVDPDSQSQITKVHFCLGSTLGQFQVHVL